MFAILTHIPFFFFSFLPICVSSYFCVNAGTTKLWDLCVYICVTAHLPSSVLFTPS